MTYREAVRQTASRLRQAGIENEMAESLFLLEYACKIDRGRYLLLQMEEMPQAQWDRYRDAVQKRCTHIPLQHLTGEQEFMGLSFLVNEHVLIPRQDTEVLVEEALALLREMCEKKDPGPEILDLCTGSGCIAVSLKSFCPEASVTASDVSGEALTVAEENARRSRTTVEFIRSDLFSGISGVFDMIVSNPPYIPRAVIPTLMPEVRDHEPLSALDGGTDGLDFYRRIIEESPQHLQKGGWLLLEIGHDQAEAVTAHMRAYDYKEIRVIQDLAGLDRVVTGRRE